MSSLKKLLLATRSGGKVREINSIVAALSADISVISLADAGIAYSPEEDGIEVFETFSENAIAKARYFFNISGLATLADDSGLEVTALGGAPGVRSKRWAESSDDVSQDDANNARLREEIQKLGLERTDASYVCAAAFVSSNDDDEPAASIVKVGRCAGLVVAEPVGSSGFGYDPYFFSTDLQKTFGSATLEEKQKVSHRGRAFDQLFNSSLFRERLGISFSDL